MNKQVDKKAYSFEKYCGKDRWVSYYHQIDEVLKTNPQTVLEIGVGDRVLENYLKTNTQISSNSLDVAEDLQPDIVGSVEKIPFKDNSFDTVCAFEVLEHLPFEKLKISLGELKRVTKNKIIISLPHFGSMIKFSFKIPFLKEFKFAYKIPYHPKHKFNGQHYWEIGKKGYSEKKIKKIIKEVGFKIEKDFIPYENSYHHFFILK